MSLSGTLQRQIGEDRIRRELTPRAMAGIAAIGGILLLYGTLLINDAVEAERTVHVQLLQRIESERQTVGSQDWPRRAAEARNLLSTLRARLWHGETPGLAQAGFQSWLRETLAEAGVNSPRIQLAPVRTDLNGQMLAEATVAASLDQQSFYRFLELVAGDEKLVRIRSAEIRMRPTGRMSLSIVAPLFIGPSPAPTPPLTPSGESGPIDKTDAAAAAAAIRAWEQKQ